MLNSAKMAVERLLYSQGLRLVRVLQPNEDTSCPETAGKIVEFIGPSGVGKTSTFRSLAHTIKDRWFFQQHIAQHHFNAFTLDPSRQSIYERLVRRRADEVMNQDATLPERANRLAFSLKIANEDMALVSRRYSRGFFIDDGLCHNFTGVLLELLDQEDIGAKDLIRGRAFIVLLADDPDFVVGNILSRRKDTPQFRGNNFPSLSHRQLRQFCAEQNSDCRRLHEFLCRIGCKNLVLRAEDGIDANMVKVKAFERVCVSDA